jgi:hypothetical protein
MGEAVRERHRYHGGAGVGEPGRDGEQQCPGVPPRGQQAGRCDRDVITPVTSAANPSRPGAWPAAWPSGPSRVRMAPTAVTIARIAGQPVLERDSGAVQHGGQCGEQ